VARKPIITLTTDFGLNDHFIGTMKGVILNIEPEAQIIDICHAVQAFDVLDGALTISQAYSYFPSGTVHMVIVDPGVGTARRPLLVTSERHHFVAPDNGVLSLIYQREERLSARHVTAEHYNLQPVSNTFHARDVFSPVAAYLAKGVDPANFGEEVTDFVRFAAPKPKPVNESTLRGVVLKVDRFGNLITNIAGGEANGGSVEIAGAQAVRAVTYADVERGRLVAYTGSAGYLEVAVRDGSAASLLSVGRGVRVRARRK
jgi:hypothetical protein